MDEELEHHFGRYQVSEYMVNTVNASHPRTIARSLVRMGFDINPQAESDRVVETCTQAAQILLFGLLAELTMRTYYESQDKRIYVVRHQRNLSNKAQDPSS